MALWNRVILDRAVGNVKVTEDQLPVLVITDKKGSITYPINGDHALANDDFLMAILRFAHARGWEIPKNEADY